MAELTEGREPHSPHQMGHARRAARRAAPSSVFFSPSEEENFIYPDAYDVDFNKRAEFDAAGMDTRGDQPARSAS